ncbi:MAG: CoA-binding protein [Polyangiales bacterium]
MGRVITDSASILAIARGAKRVAVLGIKTEQQAGQPAFYVPEYLHQAGVEVIPVPVYYPEAKQILGAPVFRRVQDVPGELDILDVFRRPSDLHAHLDDVIAKKPKVVWLQSGIEDDDFAAALTAAGIDVVQDRCLMVEHRRAR